MFYKPRLFLLTTILAFFFFSPLALAGEADEGVTAIDKNSFRIQQPVGNFGVKVDPTKDSAEGVVGVVIKNLVSLLFAVGAIGVLVMFLWGTVEWILSGGDKEKLGAARKKITTALIGLVLLSLAYMILNVFGNIIGFDIFQPLQLRGLGDRNP